MKSGLIGCLAGLGLVLMLSAGDAFAQTPQERAAQIAEWRENCADPNPDLRMAYLEAALEGDNASVTRICIDLALTSDDVDVQELGLRAALARSDRLTFTLELPESYTSAYEAARDDGARERVNQQFRDLLATHRALSASYTLVALDVSLGSGTSTWNALTSAGQARADQYVTTLIVRGARVTGTGIVRVGGLDYSATLDARVDAEGRLTGTLQVGNNDPFRASADLL